MSGWSSGFGLVAAGGVECSGAYEVMVDEDGVVGVVVVGFGLVSGPGGADADEVAAGGGDAVGSDDADGALRRCGERDAEVDRWWCGRPPFGGGDASDPTVGSLVVSNTRYCRYRPDGLDTWPPLVTVAQLDQLPSGVAVLPLRVMPEGAVAPSSEPRSRQFGELIE